MCRRRPVGQTRIVFDEPAERHLHGDECGCGLHHLTERHRAGDVLGGTKKDRNDRREPVAASGDDRGADRLHHHRAPAPPDHGERRVESGALFGIAPEQRDALAVFAQARQRVTIVRLRLVLVLGEGYEAARDVTIAPLASAE